MVPIRSLVSIPPKEIFSTVPTINWYPGHMHKAYKKVEECVRYGRVDLIVEVRDARAPLTSINWKLDQMAYLSRNRLIDRKASSTIAKMIVYNKADLTSRTRPFKMPNILTVPDLMSRVCDLKLTQHQSLLAQCFKQYTLTSAPPLFTSFNNRSNHGLMLLFTCICQWTKKWHKKMESTPNCCYPPLTIYITGLPNTGTACLFLFIVLQENQHF